MWKSIAVFLLATIAAVLPPTVLAAPITIPTGLNPGDQYRLAFVTSTTTDATSSDINYYNNFVTAAANLQPALVALGTPWTAIASTDNESARDNTGTSPPGFGPPVYTLGDTLVTFADSFLWRTTNELFFNPLDYTETGDILSSLVWTGTNNEGDGFNPGPPDDYTLGNTINPRMFAMVGSSASITNTWVESGVGDFQPTFHHLYALSGVLTVPVPEPSTMVLASLAAAGLAVPTLRRRRHFRS